MALDPITGAEALAQTIISKLWPDKTAQEQAQLAAAVAAVQGQMDVNKAEAANPSVFVAGWRPFVGWICASALAVQFIVGPLVTWGAAVMGQKLVLPALDTNTLLALLGSLLGIGGLRSYEKVKGVGTTAVGN